MLKKIQKFKSKDDPTGNIKLANLRTQSVTNALHILGVDSNVTHREIPNNGAEVVSTKEFQKYAKDPKATAALREKTSEYRYVTIKIIATFESKSEEPKSVDKVIQNYRFELVKVIESTGKTHKIKSKTTFHHKKFKCSKKKLGGRIVDACTTF